MVATTQRTLFLGKLTRERFTFAPVGVNHCPNDQKEEEPDSHWGRKGAEDVKDHLVMVRADGLSRIVRAAVFAPSDHTGPPGRPPGGQAGGPVPPRGA